LAKDRILRDNLIRPIPYSDGVKVLRDNGYIFKIEKEEEVIKFLLQLAKGESGLKEVKEWIKKKVKSIEIKHTKDKKLKKLLKESMEENIELLRELAKY